MKGEAGIRVETSVGVGEVRPTVPRGARALLVLGHGAGGGVDARDVRAVHDAAADAGYAVALTTQPYRLAGRRAPAPANSLDAAFTEIIAVIRRNRLRRIPLIVGGRSSGARVACRTAKATGASGVLALSFPLHPPGRPERSRAGELLAVEVPALVVQGERDAFGSPDDIRAARPPRTVTIHAVPGATHGLAGSRAMLDEIADTVVDWLRRLAP